MREILFKAKRIDNGEWVEGYVFDDGFVDSKRMFVGGLVIMDYKGTADDRWKVGTAFYEVDPNTICQYTGLTDKNGNKIWENDVVKFEDCEMSTESGYGDCFVNVGKIAYDTDTMSYFITDRITVDMEDMDIKNDIEVIGNAFDNTELIEECD